MRILNDGSVELFQCKRYQDKVTLPDLRNEFAKLYLNVFRGVITPRPRRVVFYIASDLTAPASNLILNPDLWRTEAEKVLTEVLGGVPPPELLTLATTWRPEFAAENGLALTKRSRPHAELLDEFFAVRKVVDASALEPLTDQMARLTRIVEKDISWAPEGMAKLLARIEQEHPGLAIQAQTTAHGTKLQVASSSPGKPLSIAPPVFPDTDAGRRGAEKFRRFVDEGRETELVPGEFEWQGPLDGGPFGPPPGSERHLKFSTPIPPHRLPVRLDYVDSRGQVSASVDLTFLKVVRVGQLEGELQVAGGRLASEVTFVFQKTGGKGDHNLTFALDLPSVRAGDALRTLELLTALGGQGRLRVSDAENGQPLIEIDGLARHDEALERLEGARELVRSIALIARESDLDIRYPAEPPDQESLDSIHLLEAGLEHSLVAVPSEKDRTYRFDLPKAQAQELVAAWKSGAPLTMSVEYTAPFKIFGKDVRPRGQVTLHLEGAKPTMSLDDLAAAIDGTSDEGLVHLEVRGERPVYAFERHHADGSPDTTPVAG